MATPLTSITGPLHAHGARTPEEYRRLQDRHLRQMQRAQPLGDWGQPYPVAEPIHALVSGGRWVVMCPCGNAPSASPDWLLACCFECGAVYEAVCFPEDLDTVEALLVARPRSNRHWTPGETADDLAAENEANGMRPAISAKGAQ